MDLDDRSPAASQASQAQAGESQARGAEAGESQAQVGQNEAGQAQAGESHARHEGPPQGARQARRNPLRASRNLPVAIAVGLVMGALVLLTLYIVKATFLLYMGVAIGVAGWELSRALRSRQITLALPALAAGCAAIWTCAYWLGPRPALAALALSVGAVLVWRLPRGPVGYLRDATANVFVLAYLPFLALFAVLILASRDGADRMIVFIGITVCSDVGGWFTGTLFGQHPLVPTISPKKTWEGLAGSVVACVGAGAGLVPAMLGGRFWQGMILGVAAVAAATLGDLVESMIKRDLEIKDMGSVLPGHGGLLERLDSLLFTAPVAWMLLAVFVPAGAA